MSEELESVDTSANFGTDSSTLPEVEESTTSPSADVPKSRPVPKSRGTSTDLAIVRVSSLPDSVPILNYVKGVHAIGKHNILATIAGAVSDAFDRAPALSAGSAFVPVHKDCSDIYACKKAESAIFPNNSTADEQTAYSGTVESNVRVAFANKANVWTYAHGTTKFVVFNGYQFGDAPLAPSALKNPLGKVFRRYGFTCNCGLHFGPTPAPKKPAASPAAAPKPQRSKSAPRSKSTSEAGPATSQAPGTSEFVTRVDLKQILDSYFVSNPAQPPPERGVVFSDQRSSRPRGGVYRGYGNRGRGGNYQSWRNGYGSRW